LPEDWGQFWCSMTPSKCNCPLRIAGSTLDRHSASYVIFSVLGCH
jgi:hypothetical protein